MGAVLKANLKPNDAATFCKRYSFPFSMTILWIYILSLCGAQSIVTTDSADITDLTIGCDDDTLSGLIEQNEMVSIDFTNERTRDVTFTDCDSTFDTTLYLKDSEGTYIHNQSINSCDGDNCYDADYCDTSYRETFTMSTLAKGLYTIELAPISSGGSWTLRLYCNDNISTSSTTPMPTPGSWTHSPTTAIPTTVAPAPPPTPSPTYYKSNSTHRIIYLSTDTTNHIIDCPTLHCIIVANHQVGLNGSNASLSIMNAQSAELHCAVSYACVHLDAIIVNVSRVAIYCYQYYACFEATMMITGTSSFRMECTDYHSCYYSTITVVGDEAEFINDEYALMHSVIYGQQLVSGFVSIHFHLSHQRYQSFYCRSFKTVTAALWNQKPTRNSKWICGAKTCAVTVLKFVHCTCVVRRLTVKCSGRLSCEGTTILCPDSDAFCELKCLGDEACPPLYAHVDNINTLTINMSETSANAILGCLASSNYSECEVIYASSFSEICDEGTDCIVECRNRTQTGMSQTPRYHCDYRILDGSQAESLRINCSEEYSCSSSTILCPSADQNATCTITCANDYSCELATIVVANPDSQVDNIQINCIDSNSCQGIKVSIEAKSVNKISANCVGSFSCEQSQWTTTVDLLYNVFVACTGGDSCLDTKFDFADAQNLSVVVDGDSYIQTEVHCPYRVVNSCNFYFLKLRFSKSNSIIIIVPEEYEYGYLDVHMIGNTSTDINVQCSPDHKETIGVNVTSNSTTSEFGCTESGATYCCPWGDRIEYNPDDHESTESDFDYDLIDLNRWKSHHEDYTYFVVANATAEHVDRVIACDDISCVIECNGQLSCALSIIKLNFTENPYTTDFGVFGTTDSFDFMGTSTMDTDSANNSDASDVVISCSASFACLSAFITDDVPSDSNWNVSVTIICSGTDSCNELTVNLTEFYSLNLYCVESGSCQEVTVNLDIGIFDDIDIPTDYGIIHCVLPSVCDDLRFNTNSERSQLMMYEFSRGIVLNNGIGYLSAIDNIECNQNRWIQFDGDLETDSTVIQSVNNQYDDDSLPCDGVTIQCGNSSCIMSYQFIGGDLVQELNDGSDTAYSVHFDDLYLITCNGECEQSPTESPTDSPTNAPTSMDDYDHYIEWQYLISDLRIEEIEYITYSTESFKDDLTSFIESGFDADANIEYRLISVNITKLNGVKVDLLEEMTVKSRSEIFESADYVNVLSYTNCSESECLYLIGDRFDELGFEGFITIKLRSYFDEMVFGVDAQIGSSVVSFSVVMHSEDAIPLNPEPVIDAAEYVTYILMGITGIFSMIGFMAFLYQKGAIPKIPRKVDTSRWTAWIGLGIQFWDFASDISLCFELWSVPRLFEDGNGLVMVCAIGSTAFLIIPYISNLWAASRITQVVHGNDEATTWFKNHSKVFTLFVVLTGGSHPALALVSSQVFGLNLFSSGLTKHEMRGLLKLKIYYSVLLENIPQLIFQAIYASTLTEGLTSTVLFASTGSLLSVLATILSYAIDRRDDEGDVFAVDYYLALERKENDQEMITLSDDEKNRIKLHRGWRLKLSRSLTAIWQIPDKTIEIGNTLISSSGCVTHIVHFMAKDAVELYASEIFGDQRGVDISPMDIIRQFYSNRREEILMILKSHFDLRGDFNVFCQNRSERKRRTMSVGSASSYGSGMGSYSPSVESRTAVFKTALNVFLLDDNDGEKMEKLMKCMDDINGTEAVRKEDVGDDAVHMISEGNGSVLEMVAVTPEAKGDEDCGMMMENEMLRDDDEEDGGSVRL